MHAPVKPSPQPSKHSPGISLVLRLAIRDLRAGLRGFGIFIACLALGVMTIAAVASASRGLTEGLAREGRRILGGDAAFSLIHREATPPELAFLTARGTVSSIATMRGMANAGEKGAALVEIKAVDQSYPTIGEVETDPQAALPGLLASATVPMEPSPTPFSSAGSTSSPAISSRSAAPRSSCAPVSFPSPTRSRPASVSARAS